ncbi:shikimate dehydrogenase [Methylovirgula sp. 4M-Z18]|uniref:shikimate dehydrogenase n=1 Tax=Methylovirgula sp. 4M-Z18 TaxID=2293567 RepID=UPI000E2F8323|nr:shikimate dehydrogenase [Methylovirgula sp. 4M-Z18]RFB79691.1 shikimate dehydrogenase [Methylovirgula sp. 4M-Z18]
MSEPQRFHLAGVMGWPVLHSRSPKIHGYWLQQHGLPGAYVPLEIKIENLEKALRALPALGFAGCNLTIPHKEHAVRMVDTLSPLAKHIGAVNCVVVQPDGALHGHNYDAFGFIASIKEDQPHWRAASGPVVVLGAGGAARAVLAGLIDEGAPGIRLINRSFERAKSLEAEFGAPIKAYRWEERAAALNGAMTLINTTSLGMDGQPSLDLALDDLPQAAIVSDIVYIPKFTPLLTAAQRRGNAIVTGLGMLLHQARPAFRDWFGVMPEVTKELRAQIEATM